jgi:hypothetical protein
MNPVDKGLCLLYAVVYATCPDATGFVDVVLRIIFGHDKFENFL